MYATLVSIAGVVIGTYQAGTPDLLLLLPPVCVVLGWTYLVNDEKVSAIGRYIRNDLGPRLGSLVESPQPIFGWEIFHRSDQRRRTRKLFQLAVDLITFCTPAMITIIVRCIAGELTILTIAVMTVETTMVVFLAQQILVNADLTRERSWSATDADAATSAAQRHSDRRELAGARSGGHRNRSGAPSGGLCDGKSD